MRSLRASSDRYTREVSRRRYHRVLLLRQLMLYVTHQQISCSIWRVFNLPAARALPLSFASTLGGMGLFAGGMCLFAGGMCSFRMLYELCLILCYWLPGLLSPNCNASIRNSPVIVASHQDCFCINCSPVSKQEYAASS